MSMNEMRFWVRLPKTDTTLRMHKDMENWKNQTAYFMHMIETYYLTKQECQKQQKN